MLAAIFTDVWHDLQQDAREHLFLTLVGLVVSFFGIRASTRMQRSPRFPWWPGSIETDSGVHVHHLFFGIVVMMVAGILSFTVPDTTQPWYSLYALAFGVGLGLTLDEYALWLHLDDVYWAEKGRTSIDAGLFALMFVLFALVLTFPADIRTDTIDDLAITLTTLLIHLAGVLVSVSKGRLVPALVGTFLPGLAFYTALRLGKPTSVWAKRFYGERNPRKQERSEKRFHPGRRTDRLREWLRDAVGGVTEDEYQAQLAAMAPPAAVAPGREDAGG